MSAEIGALAARTSLALVHHPVLDRTGKIVTTAITNLDIHDIARASRTFGIGHYYLVTPVSAQRELAERIVGHWTDGQGREHNAKRSDALERVSVVGTVDDAVAAVKAIHGGDPLIVVTGARPREGVTSAPRFLADRLADPDHRPILILFGTGWGLEESVFRRGDVVLSPIRSASGEAYNHLSVRAAVAIVCDRLFGARDE